MRRAMAGCALAVLALPGCEVKAGAQMAALPEVSGPPGAKPQIKVPASRPAGAPRIRVLSPGSGRRIEPGDVAVTNVDIRVWDQGRQYLNTWETRQPTTAVFDGRHVAKTWEKSLIGQRAGSRVLLVTPATLGFGPQGMAPTRVLPSDTLIEVFDVIGGYRPGAQVPGVPRAAGAALPQVSVPPGAEPRVTVPKAKPPQRLSAETLIEGDGPAIRPGSTFVTNYMTATWKNGQVVDSSYRRGGPNGFVLGPKTVPPGWEQALTGVRKGSRVLVVVPEELGKGFTMTLGGVGAPPGQTMIYVFDILDVR